MMMNSQEIRSEFRHITSMDCKFNSIGVFLDAYENIVDILPDLDSYLHYDLAKEVMKMECSMNHDKYSLKVDQNTPDNMIDIPLQNISDEIGNLADGIYKLIGDINDSTT